MRLRTVVLLAGFGLAIPVTGDAQLPVVVRVPDEPSCPRCVIEVTPRIRLGETDGPGSFGLWPSRIGVDRLGRFWVLHHAEAPKLYDEQGRYVREVGRTGQGPGEFSIPLEIVRVPGDSMLVMDQGYVQVVPIGLGASGLLSASRIRRLVARQMLRPAVVLSWPDTVITIADWPGAGDGTMRLQQVSFAGREARVVDSFPPLPPRGDRAEARFPYPAYVPQFVQRAGDRAVWVADRRRYHVARWTLDSGFTHVIERQPDWFEGWSGVGWGGRNEPPPPQLFDVYQDAQGILWVYSLVAADTWREAWRRANPNSRGVAVRDIDVGRLFRVIIEVIDPAARRVLARHAMPGHFVQVLEDGRLATYSEEPDGIPRIILHDVRLRRP